ncbi:doublesex- and mab-3-related transcription factor a2 [Plakobranchus ocellatus]|uniref:Doublesex- and mab-3-related transcription factor a2 n=1 Tax=Plakobranchus ocellatus TaxID=259542 RepID=A0AAV4DVF6_9GAST|nr:doublesex- and mab-3-related transcription factor a2 [Plakobranchus ocellatus]
MSPLINERMRKRRCFADKELEVVMLEREKQAEMMANQRRALHHVMQTHNSILNGLSVNTFRGFQQQQALNLTPFPSAAMHREERSKSLPGLQGKVYFTYPSHGTSSPKDFLQKVFPAQNRRVIELVWQGCGGDMERTIEQLAKEVKPSAPSDDKAPEFISPDLKYMSSTSAVTSSESQSSKQTNHKPSVFNNFTPLSPVTPPHSPLTSPRPTPAGHSSGFFSIYAPLMPLLIPPYSCTRNFNQNMHVEVPFTAAVKDGSRSQNRPTHTPGINTKELPIIGSPVKPEDSVSELETAECPSSAPASSSPSDTSPPNPSRCGEHPNGTLSQNNMTYLKSAENTAERDSKPECDETVGNVCQELHNRSLCDIAERAHARHQWSSDISSLAPTLSPAQNNKQGLKRPSPLKFSVEAIMSRS